jgi:hypothetical protein
MMPLRILFAQHSRGNLRSLSQTRIFDMGCTLGSR